ncbi:hypothetical protein STEG23_004209, partial [Scotinomys teguina]
MSDRSSDATALGPAQPAPEEVQSKVEESDMAQESPKNSAAEIPVTSNGEVDDSHDHGYHRDLKRSLPSGLGLSETQITSHGFDTTKEGVIGAGASPGKIPHMACVLLAVTAAAAAAFSNNKSFF